LVQTVKGWVAEPVWELVKASVPIACVDVIVSNHQDAVLLGWRVIHPYADVWATPGGRMRLGESPVQTAQRVLSYHGIRANGFYLVGVFPIGFRSRFDVSICLAPTGISGSPTPDGAELTKIRWFRKLPKRTGKNYVRMVEKWRKIRASPEAVRLNRL